MYKLYTQSLAGFEFMGEFEFLEDALAAIPEEGGWQLEDWHEAGVRIINSIVE